jgi:hypothetical protein
LSASVVDMSGGGIEDVEVWCGGDDDDDNVVQFRR